MTERGRSGNPWWIAYETVAMVIGLGSLALICLGWLPFALLLQPLLPQRWAQPIGRGFITRGFRFYLRLLEIFCACRFDLQVRDVLLLAGKGHEDYQEIAGVKLPFSDLEQGRLALQAWRLRQTKEQA